MTIGIDRFRSNDKIVFDAALHAEECASSAMGNPLFFKSYLQVPHPVKVPHPVRHFAQGSAASKMVRQ
jgi:hypothetical protein